MSPTEASRGETHHPGPPPDPRELAAFPARSVVGLWHRAHVNYGGPGRGCWNFSSVGHRPEASGRFDLPAPRGTCYVANTPEVAARERLGTQIRKQDGRESVLESVLVDGGRPVLVTEMPLRIDKVANLVRKEAGRWINRSLSSGTGIYAIAQAWADMFDRAGFTGICYEPRFTVGAHARGLALFGVAGQPSPAPPAGPSVALREVIGDSGIWIVAIPGRAPATLAADDLPPPL